MKLYNENLAAINNRSSDLEKGVLEYFADNGRSHHLSSPLEQKRKFCLCMQ